MTRFTLAVRGDAAPGCEPVHVNEHEVDIFDKMEQVDEHFLLEVNPKGQVPVFVNPKVLSKPLTESLDIAFFLSERYPKLQGATHRSKTNELLNDLDHHTLSFYRTPVISESTMAAVKERLVEPNISKAYKEALECLEFRAPPYYDISKREAEATAFFTEIERAMDDEGPWIYGKNGPTMLDAHFAVFWLVCSM